MNYRFHRNGAAAAAAVLAAASSTFAAVINIPSPAEVTVNSTTSVPYSGLGGDGYYFWHIGGSNQSSLATYVSAVAAGAGTTQYGNNSDGYSAIDFKGAADTTGVVYSSTINTTLATFTFSNSNPIPAEVQIGLLDDNGSAASQDTTYSVTDTSTNSTSTQVTTTDIGGAAVNHFYLVDISGASAGDVISIVGTHNGGAQYILGGITFDTVAPEPASFGLFGLAGAATLLRRRPRRGERR